MSGNSQIRTEYIVRRGEGATASGPAYIEEYGILPEGGEVSWPLPRGWPERTEALVLVRSLLGGGLPPLQLAVEDAETGEDVMRLTLGGGSATFRVPGYEDTWGPSAIQKVTGALGKVGHQGSGSGGPTMWPLMIQTTPPEDPAPARLAELGGAAIGFRGTSAMQRFPSRPARLVLRSLGDLFVDLESVHVASADIPPELFHRPKEDPETDGGWLGDLDLSREETVLIVAGGGAGLLLMIALLM